MDISLEGIGAAITGAREAITGKKIEDPVELAKIQLGLEKLEQAARDGQLQINLAEAKAAVPLLKGWFGPFFVAGWRPALGWVGVFALFFMYIPRAVVMTALWTTQCWDILGQTAELSKVVLPPFPELGTADILGLVGTLLGAAWMRTKEKEAGVSREK